MERPVTSIHRQAWEHPQSPPGNTTREPHSPIDDADVVEVLAALDHGKFRLGGDPRRAPVLWAYSLRRAQVGDAVARGREVVVSRDVGRASRAGPDVSSPSTHGEGRGAGKRVQGGTSCMVPKSREARLCTLSS